LYIKDINAKLLIITKRASGDFKNLLGYVFCSLLRVVSLVLNFQNNPLGICLPINSMDLQVISITYFLYQFMN